MYPMGGERHFGMKAGIHGVLNISILDGWLGGRL